MNPGWYSDGSGLIMEAMQSGDNVVTAAVSMTESNLIVAIGFGTESRSPVNVVPREAVTIESDSALNMILRPLTDPDPRIPKKDVSIKKRFKNGSLVVPTNGKASAGYLFFPNDPYAKSIVVVVNFNGTTFRFPFKRNPIAKAEFVLPTQDAAASDSATPVPMRPESVQLHPQSAASGHLSAMTLASDKQTKDTGKATGDCTKTITFASFEEGRLRQSGPSFTAKWIEKNHNKFPSICFSQIGTGREGVLSDHSHEYEYKLRSSIRQRNADQCLWINLELHVFGNFGNYHDHYVARSSTLHRSNESFIYLRLRFERGSSFAPLALGNNPRGRRRCKHPWLQLRSCARNYPFKGRAVERGCSQH